ncbi:MAG: hypothetical protein AAB225_13720 [Acidobacteriota bacterium]
MNSLWRTIAVAAFVAAHCTSGFGQTAEQPVVWIVEIDNLITYRGDVTDSTKLARDPGVTTPLPVRAFQVTYNAADIVVINGKPAKGLFSTWSGTLEPSLIPQTGRMIADFDGRGPFRTHWLILGPDGTWIGTLWGGMGAPAATDAIIAGNGAFFGVVGETRTLEVIRAGRAASVTEDPANRRVNGGGGRLRFIIFLYPRYRPSVDMTADGPAVFRAADFSPVTAARPARAGEVLMVRARNLGPTRPDLLPPGSRPFKADPVEMVNSPVEVTVNGKEVEVINQVGWPGTYDLYRVDFRVPSGLPPGTATIQLTAAWIPSPEVKIPVQ